MQWLGRVVDGAGLVMLCQPVLAAEVVNGITTIKPELGAASEQAVGAATLSWRGWLGMGTVIRAANPDPVISGASMNTLNDGDLNYRSGDAVSTAIESYLQADVQYHGLGMRVAGKAWYDYTQARQAVLHGNVTNHYQPGAALSDEGFVPLGRFGNAVLDDAYLYGTTRLAGYPCCCAPAGRPFPGAVLPPVACCHKSTPLITQH